MAQPIVVDADAHVAEPADLWEKNLPAKYRDRALRIGTDAQGLEAWVCDGKPIKWASGGILGNQVAAGLESNDVLIPGKVTYAEAREMVPGSRDPHERIKLMDTEGFDVSVLYPSVSLLWERDTDDPQLSAAYASVYNDWVADFCSPYPERLIPVAQISLQDVQEGVKELGRSTERGHKGIFITNAPASGIPYSEPEYHPFWAAAQDMDVPVGLHVTTRPDWIGSDYADRMQSPAMDFYFTLWFIGDTFLSFTSFFAGGVFDHFPRLKLNVLETGSGWLPYMLDIMDEKYEVSERGAGPVSKLRPSEYFDSNIWVAMEPEEKTVPSTVQMLGAHKLMWASDWPHTEGFSGVLKEVKRSVSALSESDQRKILGETAVDLYKLD